MNIAVLLGGTSAERDVSLVSGIEIAKVLAKKGHTVKAIDCAYGAKLIDYINQDSADLIQISPSDIEQKKLELNRNILDTIRYIIEEKIEVVYIALHGGYGENGQLQALLDLTGIPYTGSGSLPSALGMDKNLSKLLFQKNEVVTAPWIKLEDSSSIPTDALDPIGFPLVVKPNNQGSTVGLTIVEKPEAVPEAIQKAFQYGSVIIIEKFIQGREMTVSILDQDPLPVVEIIPEHGIYDYECKYQKGKSQYVVPAEISEETTNLLQEFAKKAYTALGCRHYARVDFRLFDNSDAYCLEVNTLPGMTPTSLVPKASRAVGIDFPELVDKIVNLAMGRH